MTKAFLFDYGGVMTDGGRGNDVPELIAKLLSKPIEDVQQAMSGPWVDYSKGLIDVEEFWRRLEISLRITIPNQLRNVWNAWSVMKPRSEMLDLVSHLKESGYRVGLLSNTIPETANEIKAHGGYDLFDFTILSYEVKSAKPEPAIYKAALKMLPGVKPPEIVFLDDQERCLVPARDMGIQTLLVESVDQAIRDVNEIISTDR